MPRSQTDGQLSIHGRKLMMAEAGNLVSNGRRMTSPCVNATISVSAENTNVRTITIQLLDAEGQDIDYVATVQLMLFTDATRTAFATTGGSTGIAIGTDGALLPVVAKKYWIATSESDGDIDLTWTDTGTESVCLGVRLPSGEFIMSDVFANAP